MRDKWRKGVKMCLKSLVVKRLVRGVWYEVLWWGVRMRFQILCKRLLLSVWGRMWRVEILRWGQHLMRWGVVMGLLGLFKQIGILFWIVKRYPTQTHYQCKWVSLTDKEYFLVTWRQKE
jgi:hypothetical protein